MTYPYHLTDAQAHDIMTGALEGGFGSWFLWEHVERDPNLNVTLLRATCPEYDDDPVRRYTWQTSDIRRGWRLMVDQYRDSRSYLGDQVREALEDMRDDAENGTPGVMDAIGTDAVLQFAAFGEVIFG